MQIITVGIGAIAAIVLIAMAVLDMAKRWVYIVPFTLALSVISVCTMLNFYAPGQDKTKLILAIAMVVVLGAVLAFDLFANDESKVGGADVVGFASIVITALSILVMYLATGYHVVGFMAWVGNNVFMPLLPALIILGVIEYFIVRHKKKKEEDYFFQAPIVPAIVFVHIYMFISSAIQYI